MVSPERNDDAILFDDVKQLDAGAKVCRRRISNAPILYYTRVPSPPTSLLTQGDDGVVVNSTNSIMMDKPSAFHLKFVIRHA